MVSSETNPSFNLRVLRTKLENKLRGVRIPIYFQGGKKGKNQLDSLMVIGFPPKARGMNSNPHESGFYFQISRGYVASLLPKTIYNLFTSTLVT